MHIRPAQLRDARSIAQLLNHLNAVDENPVVHSEQDVEKLLALSERQNTSQHTNSCPTLQIFVAQIRTNNGPEIAGVLIAYPGYDVASMCHGLHISDIVVSPNHKRHGIGRALLKKASEHCLFHDGAWISLTSMKTNIVGHKFYQALGFVAVDVQFFAIGKRAMQSLLSKRIA